MITKKICILGSFAVGKTALVNQYVSSIFSDRYLSTVGVKISKKSLTVNDQPINLVLWDMEGRDTYTEINITYLRGAMGFFIVADGTRRETLSDALDMRVQALQYTGPVPNCLLINKADLSTEWEIKREDIDAFRQQGITVFPTSAKTGQFVEEAFTVLAQTMLREESGTAASVAKA